MPYYLLAIALSVLGAILGILSSVFQGGPRKVLIVCSIAAFLSAGYDVMTTPVPKPEIYTTNGSHAEDNELYFKTEWPLTVKYTFVQNADPMYAGETFRKNIPIHESVTVSAKATFFGLKWSELVSMPLTIGNGPDLSVDAPGSPGESIISLSAYLVGGRYYPEDTLYKDDIQVEGETLSGDRVILEDYAFTPDLLVEGTNEIRILYRDLEYTIHYTALPPALIDLDVECLAQDLRVGNTLTPDMFRVTGIYENGDRRELEEFSISPEKFEENGEKEVTISIGDIRKTVPVIVYERAYAFTLVSEIHTPNGSFDPQVSVMNWVENEDYSIDGITFPVGSKVTINNWMSDMSGNGSDFATDVTCKLFFAVNQSVLGKRDRDERFFRGRFVVHRDTNGSSTTMAVKLLADGEVVYQSDTITSSSTDIPAFHVDADGVQQIVIQIEARSMGRPFVLGIAYD